MSAVTDTAAVDTAAAGATAGSAPGESAILSMSGTAFACTTEHAYILSLETIAQSSTDQRSFKQSILATCYGGTPAITAYGPVETLYSSGASTWTFVLAPAGGLYGMTFTTGSSTAATYVTTTMRYTEVGHP